MKLSNTVVAWSMLMGFALSAWAQPVKKAPKAAVKREMKAAANQKVPPILEKLRGMSAEDRQKALKGLPPLRREKLEARLEAYDRMNQRQRKNLERFQQLPANQQQQVRKVYQRFNELPDARKATLRQEVRKISPMGEEARKSYLGSEEFRGKYSDQEQQMIHQLADSFSVEK